MVAILLTCAVVGGFPESEYREADLQVLARRYRIQSYYEFRDDRDELDRRMVAGRILAARFANLEAEQRQRLGIWFRDTIVRYKSGQTSWVDPPVARQEIQLALEALDRGAAPFEAAPLESAGEGFEPEGDVVPSNVTADAWPHNDWQAEDLPENERASERLAPLSEIPSQTRIGENGEARQPSLETTMTANVSVGDAPSERKGSVFRTLGRIFLRRAFGGSSALRVTPLTRSGATDAEFEVNDWDDAQTVDDASEYHTAPVSGRDELLREITPTPK